MKLNNLEPIVENLLDFTEIPTGGKIETPDQPIRQYEVSHIGLQKVERESVDLSISIVSPPEEPLSIVNLKLPMKVYSLEPAVEDLITFTDIPCSEVL